MRPHVPETKHSKARIQRTMRRWRLVQWDLAQTLEEIAARGPREFYQGPTAEAIAAPT